MNAWIASTSLWAQTATLPAGSAPPGPTTTGGSTLMLGLRRWYSSLTLSTPDSVSGPAWLWPVLLGLAGVLVLAILHQGPGRALRQALDIAGHIRLLSASTARLRRAWRLIAVVVGTSVVCWTVSQTFSYLDPQGREDLTLLLKGRRLVSLAVEEGVLAGASPLRDIVGLGNLIPLLIASGVLVFQFSSDRWGSVDRVISARATRLAAWGTVGWGATALYATYRAIGLFYGATDLPMGNCMGVEVFVVPMLMPLADGMLLAWVAVELRNAGLGDTVENDSLDVDGVVSLMPAASLVCLLLMPARYVATTVALAFPYIPTSWDGQWVASFVRWQLGWGIIDLQGAAILAIGLVGALAWSRGTVRSLFSGYRRLLKAEGGHLLGLLIAGGTLAGSLAAVAYLTVLAMPTQTWVLAAADSYAHYATLPVGLLMMAGLVELGERSLPGARLAAAEVVEPERATVAE